MNETNEEEEFNDKDNEETWKSTTIIPFSNFYTTKHTSSNGSNSHYKLSEQLTNLSSY